MLFIIALAFALNHPQPTVQTAEIPLAMQAPDALTYAHTSYPEAACLSCRQMTTVSYRVR